jgi:hypothetical protein
MMAGAASILPVSVPGFARQGATPGQDIEVGDLLDVVRDRDIVAHLRHVHTGPRRHEGHLCDRERTAPRKVDTRSTRPGAVYPDRLTREG